MYFTQEDYNNILRYIQASGIKDSQFEELKYPFTGDEYCTISKGGKNYKVLVKNLFFHSDKLTISPRGTWVINEVDTGIKAEGPKGDPGSDGKSAYEIAVAEGFQGTKEEWLASLKGSNGVNAIYTIFSQDNIVHKKSTETKLYSININLVDKDIVPVDNYSINIDSFPSGISVEITKSDSYTYKLNIGILVTSNFNEDVPISLNINYNGIVNKKDIYITVIQDGEDGVSPLIRWNNNSLEQSVDNGKSWTSLSDKFDDKLYIKGYVASTTKLPKNALIGDIYGVGPVYMDDDLEHTKPYYQMYVNTVSDWNKNYTITKVYQGEGELPQVAQEGVIILIKKSTDNYLVYKYTNNSWSLLANLSEIYVQKEDIVNRGDNIFALVQSENENQYELYERVVSWINFGTYNSISAGIVQELGDGENVVMSQKAITDAIINKIELTALDLDISTIGKIIQSTLPCRYVVMQSSNSVGTLECISDDSHHMFTQIFKTHCILTDGTFGTSHSDEKIYTYFRSYHLSGGTSDIPQGTWGEWKLVYSSDNDSRIAELEEQIKKGVGGNKILEWNTDAATTRKQVPAEERKAGLQISYQDADGVWVNEQYVGTEFDDENWSANTNWQYFNMQKNTDILIIKGTDLYKRSNYLLQDGRMLANGAKQNECTLDFYKVKKNVKIRVYSMAAYDKAVIAFYRDKSESSFVECVKAYNNHNTSSYVSLITAEYTPKEDGYIRVHSSTEIVETDNGVTIPTIAVGEDSINQLEAEIKQSDESLQDIEIEGYDDPNLKHRLCLQYNSIYINSTDDKESVSKLLRVKKGDKVKIYTNARKTDEINSFQFLSEKELFKCTYSAFGNGYDKVVDIDYIVSNDGYIIVYNNSVYGDEYNGKKLPYLKIERSKDEGGNQENISPITNITELEGVEDYSLENLFDKNSTRSYDSEFANKVESAIGRKTDSTGCYSNNIPCKIGDYFTRSDFGTGIVVVLDGNENILGDIKNAAYTPTIQIVESEGQDFTNAVYVVFVVPVANVDTEKIVKAKYLPTEQGDYFKMPKFRLDQLNIPNGLDYPIKSTSGRFYSIIVDDSGEEPILKYVLQEGIPMSDLPQNFPLFSIVGDFSKYYDYLIFCPIEGGVTNYLYQLSSAGLVARYINKKVNCPRILKEKETWYFYGVDGSLNSSSGKLNIYKANGETFELVKGDLGNSKGESIEPHDCLLISVEPLHYICQRYVPNQTTVVNGESKIVTALHVEEIYDGKSVWEWHSEDYPELWTDSHYQGNNADYLHNNSISIANDGNLYLNNKQANQILVLKRTWDEESHTGSIGEILWKIGGNDDHEGWDVSTRIKTEGSQQWFESHDAIINSDNTITMFDNGYTGTSRILNFSIDTETKKLANFKSHTYNTYGGRYMGSADKVSEGIYLVSWGSSRNGNIPNAGVYDFNTGKALFEIKFNATGSSAYRVYGIKKGQ